MTGASIAALLLAAAAAAGQDLAAYQKLDEIQRRTPRDAAATRAWLDEAARLATLAAGHIEQRRYPAALRLLRSTERALSGAPSWNNLRGYAEFKAGDPKLALHYLQRAVHLDPQNEDYVLDIGEFLGSHGAHTEAAAFFEVAAKRMPGSPRVTFGLAVAYILQSRREEAQKLLVSLIAANPRFEAAYRALGECYEDLGNADGMVTLGRSLQSVNPRNPLGWYLEGAGLLHQGRAGRDLLPAAVKALRGAVNLQPSFVRARFALARALEQNGAHAEATAELERVVRVDPGHERAHYVLARLYQSAGESEAAKAEFARHAQVNKRDANAAYKRLLIEIRQ